MNPVFADTFYFLALLHADDAAHAKALLLSQTRADPILTTVWVLTEVADALAMPGRELPQIKAAASRPHSKALRAEAACTSTRRAE